MTDERLTQIRNHVAQVAAMAGMEAERVQGHVTFLLRQIDARDATIADLERQAHSIGTRLLNAERAIEEVLQERDAARDYATEQAGHRLAAEDKAADLERRLAEAQTDIENLQADAGNDAGHIRSLKAAISQICEAIGFPRGDANWPDWITALRARFATPAPPVAEASGEPDYSDEITPEHIAGLEAIVPGSDFADYRDVAEASGEPTRADPDDYPSDSSGITWPEWIVSCAPSEAAFSDLVQTITAAIEAARAPQPTADNIKRAQKLYFSATHNYRLSGPMPREEWVKECVAALTAAERAGREEEQSLRAELVQNELRGLRTERDHALDIAREEVRAGSQKMRALFLSIVNEVRELRGDLAQGNPATAWANACNAIQARALATRDAALREDDK